MRSNFLTRVFHNIKNFNTTPKSNIGRWNTNDNHAIKATLANMDCCGDELCGKPVNYSDNITKILNENTRSGYKN